MAGVLVRSVDVWVGVGIRLSAEAVCPCERSSVSLACRCVLLLDRALIVNREIDSCSEFLDLMSSQWETAQHCHSALSFLATRVRQAGDDSTGSTRSHAYALSNKREANPLDVSRGRRKEPMRFHDDTSSEGAARAIEEEPGQWGPALNTEFEGSRLQETMPHTDAVSPHTMNFRGNTFLADTRSSLDLNFPDVTSYFVNGPNFDLNMVDLLQEANFDSLFDGWTATP